MDRDIIGLCDAMNGVSGVRTLFSCSGHGRGGDEFYVTAAVSSVKAMKALLKAFDTYGVREMPEGFCAYTAEVDGSFWPLRKGEVNLRLSNPWVSGLGDAGRKREFARVTRALRKAESRAE